VATGIEKDQFVSWAITRWAVVDMPDRLQRPIELRRRMRSPDLSTARLDAYMAKTQTALDLLALLTVWLVVVPPGDFGAANLVLGFRLTLSLIYAIDITIRTVLARRHLRYVLANPLGVAAVVIPPIRVIFSLRLVSSVFRRGHLIRFLIAASVLVLNGAAVVYFYERNAPGSNIHTLGNSVWWSLVTVTTVGYGDFYPVTTPGRIAAVLIMFIGIITLAIVTANVASTFLAQSGRDQATPSSEPAALARAQSGPPPVPDPVVATGPSISGGQMPELPLAGDVTLAHVYQRLVEVERLLRDRPLTPIAEGLATDSATEPPSEPQPGSDRSG